VAVAVSMAVTAAIHAAFSEDGPARPGRRAARID
jgi:hypothetical protein